MNSTVLHTSNHALLSLLIPYKKKFARELNFTNFVFLKSLYMKRKKFIWLAPSKISTYTVFIRSTRLLQPCNFLLNYISLVHVYISTL